MAQTIDTDNAIMTNYVASEAVYKNDLCILDVTNNYPYAKPSAAATDEPVGVALADAAVQPATLDAHTGLAKVGAHQATNIAVAVPGSGTFFEIVGAASTNVQLALEALANDVFQNQQDASAALIAAASFPDNSNTWHPRNWSTYPATRNVNMAGFVVTNMAPGTASNHAANVGQVEASIALATSGVVLAETDTLQVVVNRGNASTNVGNLTMQGDITFDDTGEGIFLSADTVGITTPGTGSLIYDQAKNKLHLYQHQCSAQKFW
jgi:hypothetical protein